MKNDPFPPSLPPSVLFLYSPSPLFFLPLNLTLLSSFSSSSISRFSFLHKRGWKSYAPKICLYLSAVNSKRVRQRKNMCGLNWMLVLSQYLPLTITTTTVTSTTEVIRARVSLARKQLPRKFEHTGTSLIFLPLLLPRKKQIYKGKNRPLPLLLSLSLSPSRTWSSSKWSSDFLPLSHLGGLYFLPGLSFPPFTCVTLLRFVLLF